MIFSYFHESPVGGHLGMSKTLVKIREHFAWKGMDQEIRRKICECGVCSMSKPAQNTRLGFFIFRGCGKTDAKTVCRCCGQVP